MQRALSRSPVILALFFLSGFAALIYETVWTRELVLVFGATVTSASTVLAGFMAGLGLGALAAGRLTTRKHDPVRLYGWLELGIAGWAVLFPSVIKLIVLFIEKTTLPVGPVRLILVFAALLPATTLMGLTFPVLCQLEASSDAGRDVGNLYAVNLIGSCLGVLVAAYLLFPFIGLSGSHWLAVGVNAIIGLAAVRVGSRPMQSAPIRDGRADWPAFACLFVSGLCGMAFEVVWLRILAPSFNTSAYGFACITFVFLLGLGGGSWLAARLPAMGLEALGGLQILAALYAYVGYRLFELAELVQMKLGIAATYTRPVLLAPAIETLCILLPLAVLQGMLLPMAVRLLSSREDTGPAASRLYFWNTAGGIAGALLAGFWGIPRFNVQNAFLLTLDVSAVTGLALVFWSLARPAIRYGVPVATLAVLGLFAASLQGRHVPKEVLRDWINWSGDETFLYYHDDAEASVAVPRSIRRLIINGVGVTGYSPVTKMLAHIPLLLHPEPKRVLIICFGMGTTFRSAMRYPAHVDMVDIEPSVFKTFHYFYPDADRWLSDPKATLIVNDGRNHLLRAREGYDVIMVDPSPPLYAAGTVNLYSKDFFELAKRRLNPGGMLAVWLPDYPEPDFKMIMKSFVSAMPYSQIWLGTIKRGGIIMVGSNAPLPDDHARVERRLRDAGVQADLHEFSQEFGTPEAFWRLYVGPGESFTRYLSDSPEISDDFPRLEYPYFRSLQPGFYRNPRITAEPPSASTLQKL